MESNTKVCEVCLGEGYLIAKDESLSALVFTCPRCNGVGHYPISLEAQARKIIEKHTDLMGRKEGLYISFFLTDNPNYHDHWVCGFSYRKDYPAARKQIESPTIQELLARVEDELDEEIYRQRMEQKERTKQK